MSDPITLAEPIVRGNETIASIQLRKPKAGELRGLSIQELMNARATAVLDILPRIAMPPITQAEADQLEPEDLAACSGAVIDFFLTAADRKAVEKVLNA
ncbi:hypothetical protein MB02_01230 [Croceicoccus estronivorus]|nr:hypothetical protein MB02_01230 [Croceicoccus estronivorus]